MMVSVNEYSFDDLGALAEPGLVKYGNRAVACLTSEPDACGAALRTWLNYLVPWLEFKHNLFLPMKDGQPDDSYESRLNQLLTYNHLPPDIYICLDDIRTFASTSTEFGGREHPVKRDADVEAVTSARTVADWLVATYVNPQPALPEPELEAESALEPQLKAEPAPESEPEPGAQPQPQNAHFEIPSTTFTDPTTRADAPAPVERADEPILSTGFEPFMRRAPTPVLQSRALDAEIRGAPQDEAISTAHIPDAEMRLPAPLAGEEQPRRRRGRIAGLAVLALCVVSSVGVGVHFMRNRDALSESFDNRWAVPEGATTTTLPATALSPDDTAWFNGQIAKCWKISDQTANAVVVVRIRLKTDGSLEADPTISNVDNAPSFQAAADSAVRAVRTCAPFQMPKEKYGAWRDMTVTFDSRQRQ